MLTRDLRFHRETVSSGAPEMFVFVMSALWYLRVTGQEQDFLPRVCSRARKCGGFNVWDSPCAQQRIDLWRWYLLYLHTLEYVRAFQQQHNCPCPEPNLWQVAVRKKGRIVCFHPNVGFFSILYKYRTFTNVYWRISLIICLKVMCTIGIMSHFTIRRCFPCTTKSE